MKLVLATSNPHKITEIRSIWLELASLSAAAKVDLLGLKDLEITIDEPEEDQPTFDGNALLKARHYASACGMACIAEDSGLEVKALNSAPGVRSARFAGVEGPRSVVDRANNDLLLEKLGERPPSQRSARFVCAMVLVMAASQDGSQVPRRQWPPRADVSLLTIARVLGKVEGRILTQQEAAGSGRGSNGFGYDPLFLLPQLGKTTAELSPAEKNAISHRGDAARQMWRALRFMEVI